MNEQRPENFIGNRIEACLDLIGPDKKTLREKYDIGEPRECALGDSTEMKRRGYVGIYCRRSLTARQRLEAI